MKSGNNIKNLNFLRTVGLKDEMREINPFMPLSRLFGRLRLFL
jgi:hypothetical protein